MKYYKDTNNKPYVFEDDIFKELPKYGNTPILDKEGNPTGKYKQIGTYQKATEIIAKVEAIHNTTLTKITQAEYKALIAPTFAEITAGKKADIISKLNKIDKKSIRPLRAIADNVATSADLATIKQLNIDADNLRKQLKAL